MEAEEEKLAIGILMSAFGYGDICNALQKAALILTRKFPDRAINYYRKRIHKLNQSVVWNHVDNRNASTGSDLFAIGKILQKMNRHADALTEFKKSILVFFDCGLDDIWQEHFYWPETIIEDLQEVIVVIDHAI